MDIIRLYDPIDKAAIISTTQTRDTTNHQVELRDENGNFELFIDGASMGTSTDTTSANYTVQIWTQNI